MSALAVDSRVTRAEKRDILVLEQLRSAFLEYDIGPVDGIYYARLLTGGPLMTSHTLGGLASALIARTEWQVDSDPSAGTRREPQDKPTFESLTREYGLYYDLEIDGCMYKATRFNGHVLPLAETPDKLRLALMADFSRWTAT